MLVVKRKKFIQISHLYSLFSYFQTITDEKILLALSTVYTPSAPFPSWLNQLETSLYPDCEDNINELKSIIHEIYFFINQQPYKLYESLPLKYFSSDFDETMTIIDTVVYIVFLFIFIGNNNALLLR